MFDSDHTHQELKSLLIGNTLIISVFDSDHTHQKQGLQGMITVKHTNDDCYI